METIEENSSIKNFIQGVYKYIKNSFHKDDVVFHDELETFYILTHNQEINSVRDSIDKINKNMSHGVDTFEAIIEAGRSRLQPIILTTLTTLL